MKSGGTFEAISHPLRIKILKLLAKRPTSFSELKRGLRIKSSGKLDFHLKKLGSLVTVDSGGKYVLTDEGYAALQAVITVRKYGWQKRAYILGAIVYTIATGYTLVKVLWEGVNLVYLVILVSLTLWFLFYSYWSIVKRRVFKTY